MISIKNEQEIELMRKSGEITYGVLSSLKDFIKPGMSTKQVDEYAYKYITSRGATPSFLGYEGFPATACISINDMVVHGIPDDTKIKNGDYILIQKDNNKNVVGKLIDIDNDGGKFYTILKHLNKDGIKELKNLNLELLFDYPKPSSLIYELVSGATFYKKNKSALILDFFAGSGTTGHAVLDLNKSDGGNRTFILCQINEKTEENPNGIAYDVTSKRLKRIMTGECYDGTKDFPWLKDNEPYGGNLDVYEIESVANFENTPGKSPFDVIDETLYGKEKFKTVKEKIDWVCSNFEKTQKELDSE